MASSIPVSERRRRKREVEYALRLGEDERARIKMRASASGVSMAHFIRRAALDQTERQAAMSAHEAAALIRALTRVGVNLNHLARSMNAGQRVGAVDLDIVVAELRVALKTIADLRMP